MKLVSLVIIALSLSAKTAPTVVSGTPTIATGTPTHFIFTGSDLDGAGDIARIFFLIAPTPTITKNGCHGFYDRIANRFYLYDDLLAIPIGPLTPGAAGWISNSQCSVYGANSLATASGNNLAVSITIGVTQPFGEAGNNVYVWVKDKSAKETGWIKTGTWEPLTAEEPNPPNPPEPVKLPREVDEYFDLPTSLNNWVTLKYLPAPNTLILSYFIGKSGWTHWRPYQPRLEFSNPKDLEIETGEPGQLTLVYKTYE